MQTLSMAGVPWYFDETTKAYEVRPGFRFPLFAKAGPPTEAEVSIDVVHQAEQALQHAEAVVATLRELCERLKT